MGPIYLVECKKAALIYLMTHNHLSLLFMSLSACLPVYFYVCLPQPLLARSLSLFLAVYLACTLFLARARALSLSFSLSPLSSPLYHHCVVYVAISNGLLLYINTSKKKERKQHNCLPVSCCNIFLRTINIFFVCLMFQV